MCNIFSQIVGFFHERRKRKRIAAKKELFKARKNYRKKQQEDREREAAQLMLDYPIKNMTEEEVSKLPKSGTMPADFLEKCPLGTWFLCKPNRFIPGVVVVGQVVAGDDLLCSQLGAGLSVPPRGVNRYKVWFV